MKVFYFVLLTQKLIQKLTLLLDFKRGCYHVLFLTRLQTRGCRRAHDEPPRQPILVTSARCKEGAGKLFLKNKTEKKEAAGEIKDQFYLFFHSTVLVKIVDKAFFNKEQFIFISYCSNATLATTFRCLHSQKLGWQLASQPSLNIINYVQLQLKKKWSFQGCNVQEKLIWKFHRLKFLILEFPRDIAQYFRIPGVKFYFLLDFWEGKKR